MQSSEGYEMRDLFPITIGTLTLVLAAMSPAAANCKYSDKLSNEISVDGAKFVEVFATSGSLRVKGHSGSDDIVGVGKACTDDEDRLHEIEIVMERIGDHIQVIAAVPFEDDREEWRIGSLNLELDIPDSLPLVLSDSSGDLRVQSVKSLELTDSSGDIDVEDVAGEVLVHKDSSGDMDIRDSGDVTIRIDSSGDIVIENVESVLIGEDTSGDIRIRDVRGNVNIGNDTSGSITARNVGGNFVVNNDSSGEIHAQNIDGEVNIPRKD